MADIGGFFKKIAPFLSVAASLVPGGGPAVDIATGIISKITGSAVAPEKLGDVLGNLATSEQGRIQLQQCEDEYQKAMTQLGFDHVEKMAELLNDDRASARQRQMTLRDRMPAILGISVTAGFFGLVTLLAFHAFPEATKDTLLLLIGALTVGWKDVMGYYFGSSAGSDQKNSIIENLSK